jgi:lysozyme
MQYSPSKMQPSNNGLHLTESFEGYSGVAYKDSGGVLTIGYGHTGPEVRPHMVITKAQANGLLLADYHTAVMCVQRRVTVPLTQPEFDSLCDFVFNCGCGNFERSTLLRDLNAGNYSAAAQQFDVWDKDRGKTLAGLLRRREAETAEFEQPDTTEQS